MHPLTVEIITRDHAEQREIRQQYVLNTSHPRWELFKILLHAMLHMKFN